MGPVGRFSLHPFWYIGYGEAVRQVQCARDLEGVDVLSAAGGKRGRAGSP